MILYALCTVHNLSLISNSDPDYSKIVEGCTVLAKYKDDLWYRGTVEDIIKGTEFSVKFLHCNDVLLLNLHAVYPLGKFNTVSGIVYSECNNILLKRLPC